MLSLQGTWKVIAVAKQYISQLFLHAPGSGFFPLLVFHIIKLGSTSTDFVTFL